MPDEDAGGSKWNGNGRMVNLIATVDTNRRLPHINDTPATSSRRSRIF
jgi:hypothetical protein